MAHIDHSSWNGSNREYTSSPKSKKAKTTEGSSRDISKDTVIDNIDKNMNNELSVDTPENIVKTSAEGTTDKVSANITKNKPATTTIKIVEYAKNVVENTDRNRARNTVETMVENTTEITAITMAETTAENTTETTSFHSAENTADTKAETTVENAAATTAETTSDNSAENTAKTTVENTTENMAVTTADNTAKNTPATTVKTTAAANMVDTTTETTAKLTTENTADNCAEYTAETTAKTTVECTAEVMAENTASITTENTAETTVENTVDNITDITAELTNESTDESTAESTSSDDTDCPANEVVIVAPSTSAVQAILLNITRKSRVHNYGRSKSPSEDSNSSSKDSDDLSIEENPSTSRQNEEMEIEEHHVEAESRNSVAEEPLLDFQSDDDDEFGGARSNENNGEPRNEHNPPPVLLKERPKHNYFILKEVLNRELGLSFPRGQTNKDDVMFTQRFYSSLHAVYRMEKLHTLVKHKRCVNTINFNPEGHLLVSGSDDTSVVVWDWARRIPLHTIENVHKSNVFQSKFLYLNSNDQINIVTCARDGLVKLLQCNSAGGTWSRRRLAAHTKAVNKLFVTPLEPHSVLSAGEDGFVLHCDLRVDTVNKLIQLKQRSGTMALHSVHGHPLNVMELVVAGRDKFARVYDRRMSNRPFALYCPTPFTEQPSIINRTMRLTTVHLTCAIYNHDGTEILGSYSDDDIYLFNTKTDLYNKDEPNQDKDGYSLRYSGHRNSSILKPVAFYGPKSEYILSGSDCGHIYIWDKHTESIVQWLKADANGVSNTVEGHPRFPILASSGLDKDVKIWAPYSDEDPSYHGMSSTVTNNCATQWQNPLFNDFLPTLYRSWRGENRLVVDDENLPYSGNVELEANVCTTF